MCIMRNLSYHVHKEVPGADRYQEAEPGPPGGAAGSQRRRRDDAGCFGGKKAKGVWEGLGYYTLDLRPPPQAEGSPYPRPSRKPGTTWSAPFGQVGKQGAKEGVGHLADTLGPPGEGRSEPRWCPCCCLDSVPRFREGFFGPMFGKC